MNSCSWNKGGKKGHDDCCFSCCDEKTLVHSELCCQFSVTNSTAALPVDTLYAIETGACAALVAVGTIENCSDQTLTVEFVRGAGVNGGGGTVLRRLTISPNSCTTFTVARFDTIRAYGTTASVEDPIEGKICVIPRYKI
jgi:hypothetical protein